MYCLFCSFHTFLTSFSELHNPLFILSIDGNLIYWWKSEGADLTSSELKIIKQGVLKAASKKSARLGKYGGYGNGSHSSSSKFWHYTELVCGLKLVWQNRGPGWGQIISWLYKETLISEVPKSQVQSPVPPQPELSSWGKNKPPFKLHHIESINFLWWMSALEIFWGKPRLGPFVGKT